MKHYLIIGASSGIGLAICRQLAASGHTIIATYNQKPPAFDAPNVEWHRVNVLEDEITGIPLPDSLDGLVYCPGSINLRPFERIKPLDFEQDYRLQVVGAVRALQASMPALKKSGNASVVFFSTVAVGTGLPFHTQVSASKGAIEGLTRSLAAEYAPSIRVNCVAPSLTDTPLAAALLNTDQKREANAARHPLRKIGSTTDIANTAAFLLSEQAGWITGQVLHVDGGMSALRV